LRRAGTHPDLIILAGDAGARDIPVEAVRGLIESFSLTRYGALRVALIEQAERMNRAAANSLLKLLEEPPAGSLFLLTAERADLLPATIRSRIQRLTVAMPNRTDLIDWICQAHGLSRADAELLWFMGGAALVAGQAPTWDWQGVTRALTELVTGRLSPLAAAKAWQAVDRETLARWLLRVWLTVQRLSMGLSCEAPEALCPALLPLARALSAEEWLKRHPVLLAFLQTSTHPLNEELARERLALDLIDPALPARLA
jgi:DNA polymerase-3 subunit delta'